MSSRNSIQVNLNKTDIHQTKHFNDETKVSEGISDRLKCLTTVDLNDLRYQTYVSLQMMRNLKCDLNYILSKPQTIFERKNDILDNLSILKPEILGEFHNRDKIELGGLVYCVTRLPKGICECPIVRLIHNEEMEKFGFDQLVPGIRKRKCYRISPEEMAIQVVRGDTDFYDFAIMWYFLVNECYKVQERCQTFKYSWEVLFEQNQIPDKHDLDKCVLYHLSKLTGSDVDVCISTNQMLVGKGYDNLLRIFCKMKLLVEHNIQPQLNINPQISNAIWRINTDIVWKQQIVDEMQSHGLLDKQVYVVSSNLHSLVKIIVASVHNKDQYSKDQDVFEFWSKLDISDSDAFKKYGLIQIKDKSSQNIDVQIFDLSKLSDNALYFLAETLQVPKDQVDIGSLRRRVIINIDYCFGSQAYHLLRVLLRPTILGDQQVHLNTVAVYIMGKAGTTVGRKGDLMVPTNFCCPLEEEIYQINNKFVDAPLDKWIKKSDDIQVYYGNMDTVAGTILQNSAYLKYNTLANFRLIGLEMEGLNYMKAYNKTRLLDGLEAEIYCAYYASDCPLDTSSSLSSGPLGKRGFKPCYLICAEFMRTILL